MRVVMGGNAITDYLDAERCRFDDPAVRALADRVRLVVDPECDSQWPARWLGRTTVRLRSGETLTAMAEAPGTPANPLSGSAVEDKFRRTTDDVLDHVVQSQLIALIRDVEKLPDLRPITRALRGARHR
jgi:2-methylcitrate dehydratase PrpD